MTLEERKKKFEEQVVIWLGIRDSHGGWNGAARFFRVSPETMIGFCMENLKEKAKELGLTFSEPEV